MTGRTWRLTLPYARPPLSLNQRLHWARRADLVATLRWQARILAQQARIPRLEACSVELVWQPAVRRRRDGDNPMATLKPCVDGLVDAGVLDDDDSTRVLAQGCRILPPGKPAALWLDVTEERTSS